MSLLPSVENEQVTLKFCHIDIGIKSSRHLCFMKLWDGY